MARDPGSLRYYFRTFDDQTIRVVDMNKFDFDSGEMRWLDVMGFKQPTIDVSADLKPKQ